ncbi:signal transducer and activator of transcription 5B isoform X2 [Halyomorpha halys]|uniref:signal transducer and activator of transcription 5B isoform X2 n=1 Tax=Halyomorpha halys TaxID=286706 RepID=UPI0006D518DA|nr:signal transducer and activator of transcription 5B isoform X2 [Halyomorpha halys]
MSLWAKAQQLQGEALQQVRAVYGEHFPIEVRHFLAPWIEEKLWTELDPENPAHEQYAASLLSMLIQELQARASSLAAEEHFITKIKLIDAASNLQKRYATNPLNLIHIIKHCLTTELKLVQQAENAGVDLGGGMNLVAAEIAQRLEEMRIRTHSTGEDLRKLEQDQEDFALKYHECTKINAHLNHMQNQQQTTQTIETDKKLRRQKEVLEQALSQQVTTLMQNRINLSEKLKQTLSLITIVQSRILDEELIKWKREQQLAGNGAKFNNNLDTIQDWCENLAEINWLNRHQIKEAERLKAKLPLDNQGVQDILPQLNAQITQLLSSLVTSTFVIEKQPPQVMKTNTRFTATVRLLVGGKLNVYMTPPQVKVTIISEAQANSLLKNEKVGKSDASGEILNNTGTMEYHTATRQLAVSFRNMQLKKIKRAEKKGTESVMDEKFSLLFSSQFSIGNGELVFQVWTLSLPVVVIVHGNQEPHAWATVTWDNAFAESGRVPFAVPDKVPWTYVAEALNIKFCSQTGRPLSDDSLRFLAEKAFRLDVTRTNVPDCSSMLLSWSQFCKEPLPERSFTFWEWFYAVMKLTREHLKGPWMDGCILGFVRKKQAEEMLANCSNGTFLLRFSDSELGGIVIAWLGTTEDSKHSEVFMLQPFTSKDFSIRSLADRISDLHHLVYLYPDTCKQQAFSKYYTPFQDNQTTTNNGYVKPMLVTQIPGFVGTQNSLPPTPQNVFQHPQSPDTASVNDNMNSKRRKYRYSGTGSPFFYEDYGIAEMDYAELLGVEITGIEESLDMSFHELIQAPYTK